MFIFWMIWCLAAVWMLAKVDKKLTITHGGQLDKEYKWDDWFEYYNGRKAVYKVLFVLSLIPFVNVFIATMTNIFTVILILVLIAKSSFWKKGFWNKIF